LIWCLSAYAQSDPADRWEFQLAPYSWLAGQEGTVATLPGLPAADIEVDFWDDVLGNINGALMLVGEARKGRYGVVMDIVYNDIESKDSTPGPLFSSIKLNNTMWIVSAGGFYRLVEQQRGFLDLIGGVRYWSVDTELTIRAGLLPGRKLSEQEDWVDPLVGFKGLVPIGNSKFFVNGAVVIGGFDVGSEFMWDANINLGYQWTKGFATTLGYRYLDVDYEHGDFLYDVAQQGPVLGLLFRF
jgi:hypothetical protein